MRSLAEVITRLKVLHYDLRRLMMSIWMAFSKIVADYEGLGDTLRGHITDLELLEKGLLEIEQQLLTLKAELEKKNL